MRTPVGVGVVGSSASASELVRTFAELPQATLRWVCDEASPRTIRTGSQLPFHTSEIEDVLEDEDVDVVAFAATSHAANGRAGAALDADKHVFVQGPVAFESGQAQALLEMAARRSRRLWSHLPALQRPGARRLHALVEQGHLGELYYLHARHYVEGRDDAADLLWGAGVETVALVLDLLTDEPIEVLARAESYLGRSTPDVVFGELRFATGIAAHMHLSCLEPEAIDRFSVVGAAATAVLRSTLAGPELAVYPTGTPSTSPTGFPLEHGSKIAYRVPPDDSVRLACAHFIGAVRSVGEPDSGREATMAVAVVEALERSREQGGTPQALAPTGTLGGANVVELRHR